MNQENSAAILERFRRDHGHTYGRDINLTIRQPYLDLLAALGNPHKKLPPVFHAAGTNGKGSTCAFLRAILETAGYKVHVYTSPHLVKFHERIRIAGNLISEGELVEILNLCEKFSQPGGISYFEVATAAAFTAFARNPADFIILETGLGGRLDATNIIEKSLATIITRLSFDHREYLGDTMAQIATEKAGILRTGVPCFTAPQPDATALETLQQAAIRLGSSLYVGGIDWRVEILAQSFRFTDKNRTLDLPPPALPGQHQFLNAGLAIAALAALPEPIPQDAIARGMRAVEWPARLQKLECGKLVELMPAGWELWLDGGHNDSAGEILAAQAKIWQQQDNKPLDFVLGMLTTKAPGEFISPLLPYLNNVRTISVPGEPLSFSASDLAACARETGIENAAPADNIFSALSQLAQQPRQPRRILISGSLYLAGHILRLNSA